MKQNKKPPFPAVAVRGNSNDLMVTRGVSSTAPVRNRDLASARDNIIMTITVIKYYYYYLSVNRMRADFAFRGGNCGQQTTYLLAD
jgi:hypothetical protein